MKNKIIATVALSIISIGGVVTTSAALAHTQHHPINHKISFEQLDVNKDGKLTKAELVNSKKHIHKSFGNLFTKVDTNKDNKLSSSEIQNFEKNFKHKFKKAKKSLITFDTNKDGFVSKAEFDKFKPHANERKNHKHEDLFKKIDTNKDNVITKTEFQKFKK